MTIGKLIAFAGLLSFLAVVGSATAADPPKAGGYSVVAVTDKSVVAAAEFAAATHSKKEKVVIVKILKAESQVVAGTNYRIAMDVRVEGGVRQADVVVWNKLDKTQELTQWKWAGDVRKEDK